MNLEVDPYRPRQTQENMNVLTPLKSLFLIFLYLNQPLVPIGARGYLIESVYRGSRGNGVYQ